MLSFPILLVALSSVVIQSVSGHGYVQNIVIDGKNYPGWLPFVDPYASPVPERIVRKVPGDGPILDINSPDLACNKGGESGAKKVADINAGQPIKFEWTNWPADHLGPVSTYMAKCDGDCSSFQTSKAKWFKIDAAGYTNKQWASSKLIANNNSWTSTLPADLASGQYLIRNEIVALHDANAPQYYPSCAQLNVKGGSESPASSALVSIPGIYNGFKWPDIWSDSFKSFTIPGPKLVSLGSSPSNGDSGSGSPPASSSSSPSHTSQPAHSPSSSSKPEPSSSSVPHSSSEASQPSNTPQCKAKRGFTQGSNRYSRHSGRSSQHRRSHH